MDPNHLSGRFAKVVNCDDESWMDALVQVRSYNAKTESYEVTNEDRITSLKMGQLELCSPASFLSRFPKGDTI